MTPNQFIRRLNEADIGDKIIYFRGYTHDLEKTNPDLRSKVAKAFIDDRITMVQRRTGVRRKVIYKNETCYVYEYDYIAIKR